MTTVYKNFTSTSSLSDIGAMQCAATDGTHIYTTSGGVQLPENNLRLAKYTSAGALVKSRDTGSDGSGTHTQVNGIFWEPTLNRLFVSSLRNPDPQSWVFEYDTDLNLIRYHTLGAKDMEHIVEHDGYWWAVYHTLHEIEQFSYANNAFTSVAVHSLPGAAPDGETVDNLWQAILWLGNVAYLNVHNENAQSPCINAYEWNGSGFDFVATGLQPPTVNCTQGVTLAPDGVTLYWAERQTVDTGNVVIGGFAEGGAGPLDYLGEKIELARGAFALRRVSSVYTGSAVKVRRDSDDTTQDIGFDAAGDLDEAALLSFVGAGNGYVVTWYNQAQDLTPSSPNTGDLSQATTSKQPQIVGAGVVLTAGQGDRPTVRFTAASSTGLRFADTNNFVQPNWFFAAAGSAGSAVVGRQYVWDGKMEGDGTQYRHLLSLDDAGVNSIWAGVKLTSAPYTADFLRHTAVFDGISSYHRIGGVQKAAGAVGSQSYKLGAVGCNYDGTADFFDGDISEVLWFTGSLGVSSRDLVEIQQGSYFSATAAIVTLVSASIGAGSLTLTGKAMGVTAGNSLNMGAGSLSLTGQALGITYGQAMSIGAGSLALSGKKLTFLEPLVPPSGIRQSRSTRIRRIRHGA